MATERNPVVGVPINPHNIETALDVLREYYRESGRDRADLARDLRFDDSHAIDRILSKARRSTGMDLLIKRVTKLCRSLELAGADLESARTSVLRGERRAPERELAPTAPPERDPNGRADGVEPRAADPEHATAALDAALDRLLTELGLEVTDALDLDEFEVEVERRLDGGMGITNLSALSPEHAQRVVSDAYDVASALAPIQIAGDALRVAREHDDLSVPELADRLGTRPDDLEAYEIGRRRVPESLIERIEETLELGSEVAAELRELAHERAALHERAVDHLLDTIAAATASDPDRSLLDLIARLEEHSDNEMAISRIARILPHVDRTANTDHPLRARPIGHGDLDAIADRLNAPTWVVRAVERGILPLVTLDETAYEYGLRCSSNEFAAAALAELSARPHLDPPRSEWTQTMRLIGPSVAIATTADGPSSWELAAAEVTALLTEQGLTRGQLAERVGLARSSVSNILTARFRPSRTSANALGEYFGVPDLFDRAFERDQESVGRIINAIAARVDPTVPSGSRLVRTLHEFQVLREAGMLRSAHWIRLRNAARAAGLAAPERTEFGRLIDRVDLSLAEVSIGLHVPEGAVELLATGIVPLEVLDRDLHQEMTNRLRASAERAQREDRPALPGLDPETVNQRVRAFVARVEERLAERGFTKLYDDPDWSPERWCEGSTDHGAPFAYGGHEPAAFAAALQSEVNAALAELRNDPNVKVLPAHGWNPSKWGDDAPALFVPRSPTVARAASPGREGTARAAPESISRSIGGPR